jgi:hypothetical protein
MDKVVGGCMLFFSKALVPKRGTVDGLARPCGTDGVTTQSEFGRPSTAVRTDNIAR